MRLWLDDERPRPPDYDLWVQTAQEAIAELKEGKVTSISFDHDLGDESKVGNGYMVAKWIEENAFKGKIGRLGWEVHTGNARGRVNIVAAMLKAEEFWDSQGL